MDLLALENGGDGGARPQSGDQCELVIGTVEVHAGTKEDTEIFLRRCSGVSGRDPSEKGNVSVRRERRRLGSERKEHQTREGASIWFRTRVLEGKKWIFFFF